MSPLWGLEPPRWAWSHPGTPSRASTTGEVAEVASRARLHPQWVPARKRRVPGALGEQLVLGWHLERGGRERAGTVTRHPCLASPPQPPACRERKLGALA